MLPLHIYISTAWVFGWFAIVFADCATSAHIVHHLSFLRVIQCFNPVENVPVFFICVLRIMNEGMLEIVDLCVEYKLMLSL